MLTGLFLSATLLNPPSLCAALDGSGAAHPEGLRGAGIDDWIPIDDPDLARLPKVFRLLAYETRAAFEAEKAPWYLLARRARDIGGFERAFADDEKVFSKGGEFIPVDEEYIKIRGVEALFLECEWKKNGALMKLAGLYAPAPESRLTILWIAAPADVFTRALLTELKSCYRSLRTSFEPSASEVYGSLLNGHAISFELRSGRGRDSIVLEPTGDVPAADRAFYDRTVAEHKRFAAGIARNWRDEDRGVSLSMQIFQTDTSLGPKDPFVHWLAAKLQAFVRTDKNLGDAPVELIHLENARTRVVSQEEVERHYANNERAPDPGVILRTFLPRSPYARACRIRFTRKEGARPSLALFIELRTYPRSRSETVTRTSVVMLLVSAPDPADLDRVVEGLAFRSEPLTGLPPLADLPR